MLNESEITRLSEFTTEVPNFVNLTPIEKISYFSWFLHEQLNRTAVTTSTMKNCFEAVHLAVPQLSVYMPNMAKSKPPKFLLSKSGFRLEASVRTRIREKLGSATTAITISNLLLELPARVPELVEREFLEECIRCYKAKAFRASIVMVWNLAFAHLVNWIHSDPQRISDFNSAIPRRFPKISLSVKNLHDFEDLKEEQIIEVCNTAGLISGNIVNVLKEKLKRRNTAAHPSANKITQAQADDTITDLVNNVVIHLV